MSEGSIVAIYTGRSGSSLEAQRSVTAVPGKGLNGDRYSDGTGTFWKDTPDREVTLIEIEAIEAVKRDYGLEIAAGDSRRNIVTRGVALNHLVGKTFNVGPVKLEGLRMCEPCGHLARLTSEKVSKALVHRGGLRARVVVGGEIKTGDPISA